MPGRFHLHAVSAGLGLAILSLYAETARAQAGPIAAPQVPEAAGTESVTLNRRIADHNAAIERGNAERQAAWEQERARIATENEQRNAAFAAQQAAHDVKMAEWRAETAALATARTKRGSQDPSTRQASAMPERRNGTGQPHRSCRMEAVTGSLTQRVRVCSSAGERADATRNVRRNWGEASVSGCGSASCGR